ncbi:tetratricopeptide repeat protein [Burkholderia metallica]|uniref:tetratricopeptide repeat protein n=1 Tax=Burkholderia metallica TaxID=488729 RepID=UPI00157A8416|nr:tetratricopeptide repeat protein [Burkholderia metallica]NTZ86059.1 tetratricopeptide repeat protein [Burkholderia metallica]
MNRSLLSVVSAMVLISVPAAKVFASESGKTVTADTPLTPSAVDSTSAQQTAIALVQRGRAAEKAGNYPLAISYYTAALNLRPLLLDALVGRSLAYGKIHEQENSADDAMAAARIIAGDGENHKLASHLYNFAGLGYYLSNKYGKSVSALTEAINLDPSKSSIYVSRANSYKSKLDFDHALVDLKKAMELDPGNIGAKDSYAMAFADMGLYQFAIDKLNESLAADKNSSTTYRNLGQVYMWMGKYDDARRNLDKALQLDPQDPDAVLNDVELNFYTKNYAAALRVAGAWLDSNRESSSSEDVAYMLIWKHLLSQRQKMDDRASLEGESSRLRDQGSWPRPVIDFFLSRIDADQLRAAAAKGDAEAPGTHQCEAETYIGEMNMQAGNVEEAARNFETAVSLCPISWAEYDLAKFELKSIKRFVASP